MFEALVGDAALYARKVTPQDDFLTAQMKALDPQASGNFLDKGYLPDLAQAPPMFVYNGGVDEVDGTTLVQKLSNAPYYDGVTFVPCEPLTGYMGYALFMVQYEKAQLLYDALQTYATKKSINIPALLRDPNAVATAGLDKNTQLYLGNIEVSETHQAVVQFQTAIPPLMSLVLIPISKSLTRPTSGAASFYIPPVCVWRISTEDRAKNLEQAKKAGNFCAELTIHKGTPVEIPQQLRVKAAGGGGKKRKREKKCAKSCK